MTYTNDPLMPSLSLWDPNWPFSELIECIFEVREFASDAQHPIDEKYLMAELYTVLYQTGVLMYE